MSYAQSTGRGSYQGKTKCIPTTSANSDSLAEVVPNCFVAFHDTLSESQAYSTTSTPYPQGELGGIRAERGTEHQHLSVGSQS